jgi:hypothetical protein
MDDAISTECLYDRDPPHVRVFVGPVFIGDFPIHDYNRIKDALGLPDVVCDGPTAA